MSSLVIAVLGTTVLHAALVTVALVATADRRGPVLAAAPAPLVERLDVELAEPVLTLTQPEVITATRAHPATTRTVAPSVAAAAQAVAVLTTDSATSDTAPSGDATVAPGGFTAEIGTAQAPVVAATAKADGVGTDQSRAAQLVGGSDWTCPFPAEADDDDVDHAIVTMRLDIDVNGDVSKISVTKDPGHGFAREARRCALGKRWLPALTRHGDGLASATVVSVRFDR